MLSDLSLSNLQKARLSYVPPLSDFQVQLVHRQTPPVLPEIQAAFPSISSFAVVEGEKGKTVVEQPLKVGVLFSGGPAPGGHNVICGLFDHLKKLHPESSLVGFLGGPAGLIANTRKELTKEILSSFRNQGGFDLLGTGRTKIETEEQFQTALAACRGLCGLIVIGGDDSNTNAALMADYFLQKNSSTRVIGVPKTIDGDLQNAYVQLSFGFDTAAKVYSEMIGNLAKDAVSAGKYYHFIKLMGRSASHITLECALCTHPNLAFISEEKKSFSTIVDEIVEVVQKRAALGKNYGVILIPEGLAESMPGVPEARDAHGNLNVSAIQTEEFLIDAVKPRLSNLAFHPLSHFFGYEGRCAMPTNFDAAYGLALGAAAALLVASNKTGYMAFVRHLDEPYEKWTVGGVPLASLLHKEERGGKSKPVIAKAYVEPDSFLYRSFAQERSKWALEDDYRMPGPIQYFGDAALTNLLPRLLVS